MRLLSCPRSHAYDFRITVRLVFDKPIPLHVSNFVHGLNYHHTTFSVPAQIRVDAELLEVTFSDDTVSLDYLIPTLTGPGVCTVALVYALVSAHNAFVEKYRREISKRKLKGSGPE